MLVACEALCACSVLSALRSGRRRRRRSSSSATPPEPGARITPYLQFQLDRAWAQDDRRRAAFATVRTEADLRAPLDGNPRETCARTVWAACPPSARP